MHKRDKTTGFTIVELLIVIVIIGILATIVIIAYNGITTKARVATLQSDVSNNVSAVEIYNASNGSYPNTSSDVNDGRGLANSGTNTSNYYNNSAKTAYCVSSTGSDGITYAADNVHQTPIAGTCSGAENVVAKATVVVADGVNIQDITTANCPTDDKVRAVDARDNHTYWVQKLADGKCWMLTNLAYAGGGTNDCGDVISTSTLTNGTTDGSPTYTDAKYYVPVSGSNVTTEPTNPSALANGTGQYGYLYNWCVAMDAQVGTSTCNSSVSTDNWDHNISVCPSGWRLPTSNGGEFTALNVAVNSGSTSSLSGLLSTWLAQYSGIWNAGSEYQGSDGAYWSSTQYSAAQAYNLYFFDSNVYPANSDIKNNGYAVRCLAT